MTIDNERQKLILEKIIQEYINSAEPVSSKKLEEKYNFGVCPATIRNEMQRLTDFGFLFQPHTSAGRVPTDKAYRFFVNNILESDLDDEMEKLKIEKNQLKRKQDAMKWMQFLTKELASLSSSLAVSYLGGEGILWKEGWEDLLQEPEFQAADQISDFVKFLKTFEEGVDKMKLDSGISVFIGKETPFSGAREFSLIICRCSFPDKEDGFVSLLGPKRMAYDKNIALINYVREIILEL
jgi:heat-inducible transcriptional repressor